VFHDAEIGGDAEGGCPLGRGCADGLVSLVGQAGPLVGAAAGRSGWARMAPACLARGG
jgi:hypothetical protein